MPLSKFQKLYLKSEDEKAQALLINPPDRNFTDIELGEIEMFANRLWKKKVKNKRKIKCRRP